MKQQPFDPWTSPQYTDAKCTVCTKCRVSVKTGRCVYGGPFKGYSKVIPRA